MLPRGLGALLTTDVETVELGSYHGQRLRGRVEHRTLRLAAGQRFVLRVTVARARPVAVEVEGPVRSYALALPVPPDPYARAARRALALLVVAAVLACLARRRRARR